MVTPAVAYLEVVANPATRQATRVDYHFSFDEEEEASPQHDTRARFSPEEHMRAHRAIMRRMQNRHQFPKRGRGNFSVTRQGEMLQYHGEEVLPYDFDPIGGLAIEDLSHEGKQKWSTTKITEFHFKERGHRFPMPRVYGLPPDDPLRSMLEPNTKRYPATERVSYQITNETSKLVTFTKTYEFRTLDEKEAPLFHQEGSGTIVFDKKNGMPVSLDYQATLRVRSDDGTVQSVPCTLTYKLRDPKEVLKEKTRLAVAKAARHVGESLAKDSERKFGHRPSTNRAGRTAKPKSNPQRIDELIAIIKKKTSENRGRRSMALCFQEPEKLGR